MTLKDWLTIGIYSVSILALIFAGYFLYVFFKTQKKLSKIGSKKYRNSRNKKNKLKQRKRLLKRKKVARKNTVILLLMGILLFGGYGLYNNYQAMTLSKVDKSSVAKGYSLINDFEDHLKIAKEKSQDQVKTQENIRYLATRLASYGILTANKKNSAEGQQILNRYYTSVTQLGINASLQTNEFYGNQNLVDEYLADIQRVKENQAETLKYYKVDQPN